VVLGHYLWMHHREGYEQDMQKKNAKGKKDKDRAQANHPVFKHREALLRERLDAMKGKAEG
jgi:hypothetical protein